MVTRVPFLWAALLTHKLVWSTLSLAVSEQNHSHHISGSKVWGAPSVFKSPLGPQGWDLCEPGELCVQTTPEEGFFFFCPGQGSSGGIWFAPWKYLDLKLAPHICSEFLFLPESIEFNKEIVFFLRGFYDNVSSGYAPIIAINRFQVMFLSFICWPFLASQTSMSKDGCLSSLGLLRLVHLPHD